MKEKKTKKTHNKAGKQTVIKESGSDLKKPVWAFDQIDKDGPFAFNINRQEFKHKEFIDKIVSYSAMTWADIKKQTHDNGKSKNHNLDEGKLSVDAIKRLEKLNRNEESDSLFSFAFNNMLRIIGIREKEVFHVMWYDNEHRVCPSTKKNN